MSDSDEDNFQLYGTLLEPYDEDAVPKKKAFTIEDQIATDEQGRRRFHGAFTGGFSAGFFNTVGSLEGWTPSDFKSSRSEKAAKKLQKPQDFMDDEDVGEFGIAPSVVRATSDYSNKSNRKRAMKTDEGPIPGVPYLETLLQPAKETVGIKLLKRMGWKPGQGVGPRVTKSQKRKQQIARTGKIYGCEIPEEFRAKIPVNDDASSSSEDEDDELSFAPDDYEPFVVKPKDNTFGMGYAGLDKRLILSSHISLFDPPPEFKMRDHKNSKISISGQAFGVGAFEQEDEDIYTRDDMSKYDFELDSFAKKRKNLKQIAAKPDKSTVEILEGFVIGKNPVSVKKSFPPPVLPRNFIPKHGVRISRFEPLPENHKLFKYDRTKSSGRHDLSASERSKIINSESIVISSIKSIKKKIISTPFNVPPEEEQKELLTKAAKITEHLNPTMLNTNFKPFISNPDKQNRYEQYLTLEKLGQEKQLHEIQPVLMADWEKERERYEFAQAARMFKPVVGLVFDKFVTASVAETDPFKPVEKTIYQHGTQDMRDAAKKKMFGPLTRNIEIWIPNKLLCKRFNVPEPDITETEMALSKKKKGKFNVFDYYEAHQQNKTIKEGPELQKNNTLDKENINLTAEESNNKTEQINVANTDNNISVVELNTLSTNIPAIKVPDKVDEKKVNTFKTSRSLFLEEAGIPSTSKSSEKNEAPTIPPPAIPKPVLPQPTIPIPTDPKEKKDLFKAIFLSSSESEDEKSDHEDDKKKQQDDKMCEMKKIVLEEDHKITFDQTIVNATKGILSDLDWTKVNRTSKNILESSSSASTQEPQKDTTIIIDDDEPVEDIYGPKLPTQQIQNNVSKPAFRNVSKESSSSSEDEWMEANSTSEKSNKTSKKHKKHKSKHKKHKSKHKKKKHSRH